MKREIQLEEARVDYLMSAIEEVKQAAKQNYRFGFDGPISLVLKRLYLLGSQMYGPRVEKYLSERLGVERINGSIDRGDFKNNKGAYLENKVSYSSINGTFNFLQFRPHQKLDGCLLTAIDRFNNFTPYFFLLTDEQITYELEKLGGLCHFNKEIAALNKNVEYRITLDPTTTDWTRWRNNYEVDSIECLKRRIKIIEPLKKHEIKI